MDVAAQTGKLRAAVVAVLVIALISALPLAPAHAQQQTSVTLSCDGQRKLSVSEGKIYPVTKMGMIVKLKEHEVSFDHYVAQIESITDTQIAFRYVSVTYSVTGIIDRVTGKTTIEKLYEGDMGSILTTLTCRDNAPFLAPRAHRCRRISSGHQRESPAPRT